MSIKEKQNLQKISMNLFQEDVETLEKFFGSGLGWTVAARAIIHKACRRLQERESQIVGGNNVTMESFTDD